MVFRVFLYGVLMLSAFPLMAKDQPNILLIVADDCTYNDLPMYGGKNAKTPHLMKLAEEGLTFNKAYLSEAMCQPCRAELYTGQYPMSNGCAWNHSASKPQTKSLPHYLEPLGYRVGIAGKVHVKPKAAFPFEMVKGFESHCVRTPTADHDTAGIRDFMSRSSDPFCLVVGLVEPHVPWVMGDASQYPPKKIKLPENIADTPRTREDFGKYLAEVTYMDSQVGDILKTLQETGRDQNTLVLFTSEQGSQFPGCKWTNWDTGVHTALIAKWPGKIQKGQRTKALVQYTDIVPTLIDAAKGNPKQASIDGTSFLKVLKGERQQHREFVYGVHNNIPEGPSYPIRSIGDGTYRYIRNLSHGEIYIEKHLMGASSGKKPHNDYWFTWVWGSHTSPSIYNLVKRYMHRPAEELYHIDSDAYEMKNLAGHPDYQAIQAKLSAELDRWMKEQGDPGAIQDTYEVYQAAKKGEHVY